MISEGSGDFKNVLIISNFWLVSIIIIIIIQETLYRVKNPLLLETPVAVKWTAVSNLLLMLALMHTYRRGSDRTCFSEVLFHSSLL